MYEVKKRFEISAAHKLDLDYDSKCTNFHGHNWIIDVYLQSETLDKNGMVLDFTHIKRKIQDKLYRSILLPKTWRNIFAMSLHRSVIVLTYRKVRTTLQATSKMMLK
mgnify:CR=1 FL=1